MSLFRERRQWAPEPIVSPFPGAGFGTGGTPSIDQAMRISAVWACIKLLSDTVSMMPLTAYTMSSGVRVPTVNPPLLVSPGGPDASMPDWLYMLMSSLLLRGNSYGKISLRGRDGYPSQIDLLNPDDVQVRRGDSGRVVYSTDGGIIPNIDMWHMRAFRLPGSVLGLSPIQYAASQIRTEAAIQSFALGYFTDAPHPPSVIESDKPVNQAQALTIKEKFLAAVNGREPLVLGAGLKYTPLSVTPEESQFLATQKLGVASIARLYTVPPEMIAAEAGNSLTYSNIESKGIDFLTYSVQPWLTRIEAAVAAILPGRQHARFDTSVLLRTDLEGRTKAGAIAIASKQQTPDEVRAWSDLPPLTEEQKTWLDIIPLSVTPSGLPKLLPTPTDPNPAATEGEPA